MKTAVALSILPNIVMDAIQTGRRGLVVSTARRVGILLGFGLVGTVEVLFSKTLEDIDYQNLNLSIAGQRPDGRPFYTLFSNPAFRDVVVLTNTTEGSSWTVATKLERQFRSGWYAQGSYLYGDSKTVNDGGSSQARSNWVNNYFGLSGVNDVPVATSNFSPGHRITLSAIYTRSFGPTEASFSAYYNGQNGRPYAYRYSNDVNVDGGTTNDLFYIPRDANDVLIANGTFDQLMAFINECDGLTPGTIVVRNSCRAPWTASHCSCRAAWASSQPTCRSACVRSQSACRSSCARSQSACRSSCARSHSSWRSR